MLSKKDDAHIYQCVLHLQDNIMLKCDTICVKSCCFLHHITSNPLTRFSHRFQHHETSANIAGQYCSQLQLDIKYTCFDSLIGYVNKL